MIGMNATNISPEPETPRLAMRPREAAKAMGVSERTLWDWTNQGLIPYIRLGNVVLYPVDSLREWLQRQAESAMANDGEEISEKSKDSV